MPRCISDCRWCFCVSSVLAQKQNEDDNMTIYFMKMLSMTFFFFLISSPLSALAIEYWIKKKKKNEGKRVKRWSNRAKGTIINQNVDDVYWSTLRIYIFIFVVIKLLLMVLLIQYRRFGSFSFIKWNTNI